jgi:hypothetical protein
MPPSFLGYQPHSMKLGHRLLKETKELQSSLPSTEDLLSLQEELRAIRVRVMERIQRAEKDAELFQSKWDDAKERRVRPQETLDRAREKLVKARGRDSVALPNQRKRETSGENTR